MNSTEIFALALGLNDFWIIFQRITRDKATALLDLAMKQIIESDEAAA